MGTVTFNSLIKSAAIYDSYLDGSNGIDIFPIFVFDPAGAGSPDYGTITIQGVTFPCELWAENEYIAPQFELNHMYKAGARVDIHCRLFPVDDTAGTVNFEFNYFILHVNGTTTDGAAVTLAGTIAAGQKTANTGNYIDVLLDATDLHGGDQIIGTFKRTAGTYASDVAVMEIGMHIGVGKTGYNFS